MGPRGTWEQMCCLFWMHWDPSMLCLQTPVCLVHSALRKLPELLCKQGSYYSCNCWIWTFASLKFIHAPMLYIWEQKREIFFFLKKSTWYHLLEKCVFKVKMSTDLWKLQAFYRLFWLFILCHRIRFQHLLCTFGHLLNWAIASLKTHHSSVLYLWTSLGSRGLESALEWMNGDCLSEFLSSACQYLTIQNKTKTTQRDK